MTPLLNRPLIVVGAGWHAAVVVEALQALGHWKIIGLLDPHPPSSSVLGVPVLGGDEMMSQIFASGVTDAVIAIGDNALRERLGRAAVEMGFALPSIVHPTAFVSPSARIGKGVVVMARAVIGTLTVISDLAVINTGAVLDHDNWIGVAAHIAPGCALAGCVTVSDRALVGVGTSVRPETKIGADAIVGAGSAVVAEVPERAMVGGAPARALQKSVLML